MATYGDLIARIANDMGRSKLEPRIREEVNSAIEHYQQQRFHFNEVFKRAFTVAWDGSSSTADNSESISLSGDFLFVDTVEVFPANVSAPASDARQLEEQNWHDLIRVPRVPGEPRIFCLYSEQIFFRDIPDDEYLVNMALVKLRPIPSSDGESNPWTQEAFNLIRLRAEYFLYQTAIRDPRRAQAAKAGELDELNQLENRTSAYQMTGYSRKRLF